MFADGPVSDQILLVHGVLGGVSSLAAQLARWGGATVIGTVRRSSDVERVPAATADHVVALDGVEPIAAIRTVAVGGVDRVVEVALDANADLDNAVVANGAVIAAYATTADRTTIPFWTMLFNNVIIRLLGSDDFPSEAKQRAARDLTDAAAAGAVSVRVAEPYPLERTADAHDAVDAGAREGRVLVRIVE